MRGSCADTSCNTRFAPAIVLSFLRKLPREIDANSGMGALMQFGNSVTRGIVILNGALILVTLAQGANSLTVVPNDGLVINGEATCFGHLQNLQLLGCWLVLWAKRPRHLAATFLLLGSPFKGSR